MQITIWGMEKGDSELLNFRLFKTCIQRKIHVHAAISSK